MVGSVMDLLSISRLCVTGASIRAATDRAIPTPERSLAEEDNTVEKRQ